MVLTLKSLHNSSLPSQAGLPQQYTHESTDILLALYAYGHALP